MAGGAAQAATVRAAALRAGRTGKPLRASPRWDGLDAEPEPPAHRGPGRRLRVPRDCDQRLRGQGRPLRAARSRRRSGGSRPVGILRRRSHPVRLRSGGGRGQSPAYHVVRGPGCRARLQPRGAGARSDRCGPAVLAARDSGEEGGRGSRRALERALIYGWDLGGAHVKLAVLEASGALARVVQRPCPLWLGEEHLERVLRELGGSSSDARHALTLTGELADRFPDRRSGVAAILETFQRVIDAADVQVFAGGGFVDPGTARGEWSGVASANWLATAAVVARHVPHALVLDIGSTTTDVIPIAEGRIRARGRDDHGRLACEELVYTGVARTPVAAMADAVPVGGEWVGLMAEHFATAGDVYRITGELDPRFDQSDTADGGDRSHEASMRRLARMVGCDVDRAPAAEWERLARWLSHTQAERIGRACDRVLSLGLIGRTAPVVGAGVGQFLAARVAIRLGRPYVEFATLVGAPTGDELAVNTCGPAYAIAELLRRSG